MHTDPEAARRYNREYKRANRWRYAVRQKAYDAAKHANERAAAHGASGTLTADEVESILAAEACHWCDGPLVFARRALDHIVPLANGGLNRPENIVVACRSCNTRKAAKPNLTAWSASHPRCVRCLRTDRSHAGRGHCTRCYHAVFIDPVRRRHREAS